MAGLGRCANINFFSVLLGVLNLTNVTMFVYRMGVLTTVESRFNLSSSESSFSVSSFEIGHVVTIFLLTYYARNSHIPRIVGISAFVCAASGVVVSIPHFIYGSGVDYSDAGLDGSNSSQATNSYGKLCGNSSSANGSFTELCGSGSESGQKYPVVLFLLILSGIMLGASYVPCNTLALTYVDKNVRDPKKAPLYIGIISGMTSVGGFVGFLVAALATRIYIDPGRTPWPSQDNPRWLGAWWLGSLLAAAVTSITFVPFMLFPRSLKEEEKPSEKEQDTLKDKEDVKAKAKEALGIFGGMKRLFTNPVYMAHLVGFCMDAYIWGGLMPYIAKYMEVQYRQTPAMANLFSAIMSGLACSIGNFFGGFIASRVSGRRVLVRYMLGASAISTAGMIALMFVHCDTPPLNADRGLSCNVDCGCSQSEYFPVCGSDGVDYLTPCHAGCAAPDVVGSTTNFSSCTCLPGGYATQGECSSGCSIVFLYSVILFILGATSDFNMPVNLSATLKVVDEDIAAFALGIMNAGMSFLAMIPGPSIYGAILDQICRVWQVDDCGVQGTCVAYDITKFRYVLHGLTGSFKFIGMLCYLYLVIKYRHEKPDDPDEGKERESVEMPEKEKMLTADT